jgi:hypothetical protein
MGDNISLHHAYILSHFFVELCEKGMKTHPGRLMLDYARIQTTQLQHSFNAVAHHATTRRVMILMGFLHIAPKRYSYAQNTP